MNQQSRRFHVRSRPEPTSGEPSITSWNLFARLEPSVALALHKDAVQQQSPNHDIRLWTVSQKITGGVVDFLPLEITLPTSGERAYVSYNGGTLHSIERGGSKAGDNNLIGVHNDQLVENGALPMIELPSSVLPKEYELQPNSERLVLVRPLPSVRDAITVYLEPLSVDAWELLESHAEFLEDGGLLQQVTLVYPNQILPLRVKGRDIAHARVLPSFEGDVFKNFPCLRLMAETEVIVSPPPNPLSRGGCLATMRLRVFPTWLDYSNPMRNLADKLGVTLVQPADDIQMGYVHPKTLRRLRGGTDYETEVCHDDRIDNDETERDLLACVEVSPLKSSDAMSSCQVIRLRAVLDGIPPNHVGLHPLVGLALQTVPLVSLVKVRLLASSEIALGSIGMLEKINSGDVKLAINPITVKSPEYNHPWKRPSMVFCPQALSCLNSVGTCFDVLVWQPESFCFQVIADNLDDVPFSSGSFLTISIPNVGFQRFFFCLTYECRADDVPLKAKSSFLFLGDLVDLLNKDSLEVMKHFDRLGVAQQVTIPQAIEKLNILPQTWLSPHVGGRADMSTPCHTMITGPVGSGRSHMALMLAAKARICFGFSTHYVDCKCLKLAPEVRMKGLLDELTASFQEALQAKPAVIILDNLEDISPNLLNDNDGVNIDPTHNYRQVNPASIDQAKLVADHIRQLITESCGDVVSVVTCSEIHNLASPCATLLPWMALSTPLKLNPEDRRAMFFAMLQNFCPEICGGHYSSCPFAPTFDRQTEGFRACDFETVARRVVHLLRTNSVADYPKGVDLITTEALHEYVPVARQSVVADDAAAIFSWSEIGGLFHVKASLTEAVLHPVKYRRIYEKSPIKLPRGILLFGPLGCGKSILVPALAKECGFRLVTCRGPELLDKYIGASEAKVRELFARARAASPCILFLDEFDALAPRRGSDNTGVTDRVVNQLLTFLDGVEDALDDMMYIIAATSRPDKIDPALLRPGRLEKHFYVGFPETQEEWMDLLIRVASKWSLDKSAQQVISSGDMRSLFGETFVESSQALHFSGADMKAIFDSAYISAVHDCLKKGEREPYVTIQLENLQDSFRRIRPCLSTTDRNILSNAYRPFLQGREENQFVRSPPSEMRLKTTLR